MPEVMSIEVDEEFDARGSRPPSQFGLRGPEGNLNFGVIAGIGVAVLLVIALLLVVVKPFGSAAPPVKTVKWTPTNPLKGLQALPALSQDDPIVTSLQSSLNSLAKYYTTGELGDVEGTLDLAGPMYAQAQNMQAEVQRDPDTGLPATIDIISVGDAGKSGNIYTVRAVLMWTKPGQTGTQYKWDLKMSRKSTSNTYLLYGLKDTTDAAPQPLSFCDAMKLISTLENNEKLNDALGKVAAADKQPAAKSTMQIRYDTWKYVARITGGTPDQGSVDTIVNQYKDSLAALDEAKSLPEFGAAKLEIDDDENVKQAHSDIEQRSQDECSTDISLR